MAAPIPSDEIARIGALRRYDILDTPREREFDDVVDIARRVCGTSIALISFVDTDRQWFKAEVGLGSSETPLESSICAIVFRTGNYVEIPDTLADPRLRGNPLCCAEPGLRFYAGATLQTAEGLPIGSLCVLDYAPRTLDALQRDTLLLLAAQVMRQLDLRAALAREALLRREIDHRVKNSLQTVGAFVRLQRSQPTGNASDMMLAVERQIASVATLHDLISEVDEDWLDLGDYLDRLTRQLAIIAPAGVAVSGRFDALFGPATAATALGTIVNELVANALKHSFDEGVAGAIVLTGSADGNGNYDIACSDDGCRAVEIISTTTPTRIGLGLRVMQAAIRKVNGTLTGGPVSGGYRSLLSFPEPSR
ncbi:GAF domain-containing protein [Polymorphobacter sp. PAMC 29334]|uniref:histidine kinase dimerization/phosphoacceptor domain -containing protein n=1 Tax=Polymorphobacter sp. PAMC 29334 TaxID=2862331 RepID=UPI001C770287|nr:histidine kinase dimerization/phosphoacceptor domain -containing protein [Polymorphobacter sp. PAMC 29334]QYE34047.1 GAF domain-containing protein [Polymorphobacter sp. PAMC 29334]